MFACDCLCVCVCVCVRYVDALASASKLSYEAFCRCVPLSVPVTSREAVVISIVFINNFSSISGIGGIGENGSRSRRVRQEAQEGGMPMGQEGGIAKCEAHSSRNISKHLFTSFVTPCDAMPSHIMPCT